MELETLAGIVNEINNLAKTANDTLRLAIHREKSVDPSSVSFAVPGDNGEEMVVRIERQKACDIVFVKGIQCAYSVASHILTDAGAIAGNDGVFTIGSFLSFSYKGNIKEFTFSPLALGLDPLPRIAELLHARIMEVRAWVAEEKRKVENTFEFKVDSFGGAFCHTIEVFRSPLRAAVWGGDTYYAAEMGVPELFQLSRLLTGTTDEGNMGIFNQSNESVFVFNGHQKTFHWNPINYDKDSAQIIASEIQGRSEMVKAWVKELQRKAENLITFTLDSGETVRIEREPFEVSIGGKRWDCDYFYASDVLTGGETKGGIGIFGENGFHVVYNGVRRVFSFAYINFQTDPAARIIAQLRLRIKSVRAWVESLVAEEESRKESEGK